jgi:hypothetical protein
VSCACSSERQLQPHVGSAAGRAAITPCAVPQATTRCAAHRPPKERLQKRNLTPHSRTNGGRERAIPGWRPRIRRLIRALAAPRR